MKKMQAEGLSAKRGWRTLSPTIFTTNLHPRSGYLVKSVGACRPALCQSPRGLQTQTFHIHLSCSDVEWRRSDEVMHSQLPSLIVQSGLMEDAFVVGTEPTAGFSLTLTVCALILNLSSTKQRRSSELSEYTPSRTCQQKLHRTRSATRRRSSRRCGRLSNCSSKCPSLDAII
ncbi:hypothetical protein BLNAU_21473 [Blattamonas nauphoetae]|uniref:Uncharacterized protein n=1 Tax=Blattamonas nauphoetae TaxID=2049346 RepID=A0ABQ9WW93_9EUKA|nr:hypothetical protein BLNAU_21473 [Blattamonas nauphoetae]